MMQPDTLVRIYEKMVQARALDEILAQTRILGNPFYIGSTFEEPLVIIGMLMNVGQGVNHDVLAAYYRSLPIVLGMGHPPEYAMRQAAMRATDPYSAGRQMVSHFSDPDTNVIPVSSCVTSEAGKGYGTALVQKMLATEPALTVVHLGDAMCAEADFWVLLQEMALKELPVLVLISNNAAGIHTPYRDGSAAPCQSAWGIACKSAMAAYPTDPALLQYVQSFNPDLPLEGVQYVDSPKAGWKMVDGTDVLSVYRAAQHAFDYIRRERKPYILEVRTERGRHHSSSSNPSAQILEQVRDWDPLVKFERQLELHNTLTREQMETLKRDTLETLKQKAQEVLSEPAATDAVSGMYYPG